MPLIIFGRVYRVYMEPMGLWQDKGTPAIDQYAVLEFTISV
jgi:hypothetical protein